MITLKNVNKYYFKHKKNEIHVINNTSLDLDNKGLVALLGPSGCGKTTLLNAIGGLDKVNSGTIYINGKKMPKIGSSKKDKIRVLNIGYIFQNYNLLDNLTVYENVAISLKMIGIKNRLAIKKRVDYILESVGMYRYRNKSAGMLSGGQRQRVGIARALVKNPEVIIADEPTGNLDSKNTIEIMNIIKAISKDKLVILVTHEKDLAHFYASRIIELEDGKIINDYENSHENELDYRIDNKIYLKDFKNIESIENNGHNINIYRDKKEHVKVDIVIKNGNIYIKSNNNNKIEVVNEDSGIEFINENYKKISKEDYEKSAFDLSRLDNSNLKLRYASIYNIFSMIKTGFKKVKNYTLMKKILLLGFFVSAMFIVYSISSIFGSTNIRDNNFLRVHRNYVKIENNSNSIDDYEKIEALESINYIIPGDSIVTAKLSNKKLFQLTNAHLNLEGSLSSIDIIDKDNIILGNFPTSKNEIVIDKTIIENAITEEFQFKMAGLSELENFIGETISFDSIEFKIVGISDSQNPCMYIDKEYFIDILGKLQIDERMDTTNIDPNQQKINNFETNKDNLTIKEGHSPKEDYEVIVNIENKYNYPLNKTIDLKINDKKLKVVGYFTSKTLDENFYVSAKTYKNYVIKKYSGLTVYSKDKENIIEELNSSGYNAIDTYKTSKDKYINNVKENIIQSLIISGILLAISFVEIFLMIRASFLSRVKEIGIYRAIGVKKTDVYKMFLGEILIITTIAGVPGLILMSSILKEITKISIFGNLYMINTAVIIISLIFIYGLNIIVGLFPIRQTIKKTPSEILSRNDVD